MARKGNRLILGMVCDQCHSKNYITERNRVNTEEKLVLKKYCPKCRAHTKHKETQKLK